MKIFTLPTLTLSLILFCGSASVNAQTSPGGGHPGAAPQGQQRSAPDITKKDKKKYRQVRKDINNLNQKFDKKLKNIDSSNQGKIREVYSKHQKKLKEKVQSSGLSVQKYNYMVNQQRSSSKQMGQ